MCDVCAVLMTSACLGPADQTANFAKFCSKIMFWPGILVSLVEHNYKDDFKHGNIVRVD